MDVSEGRGCWMYGRGGVLWDFLDSNVYFSVISNDIDTHDDDVHVTVLSQSCLLSCIPVR